MYREKSGPLFFFYQRDANKGDENFEVPSQQRN